VIVYGRNPVHEAIRGPRQVRRIWATKGAAREPWLASLSGITSTVSADEVERVCAAEAHQGVCAEVSAYRYAEPEELLAGGMAGPEAGAVPLLVVLDQIQDPQNLGAIARTAECAGVTGLVIPERRAAEVTAAVCKASAGAVEHLQVARVRNVADFLTEAKRAGVWCYGADQQAASDYAATDLSGPVALVLGSEGRGLRPRVAAACDGLISIPLRGRVESLSVSAAAAVLIFAASRRRQ
jgi:23S rRNA (guanosine2251-2'-O)-methyltransferase